MIFKFYNPKLNNQKRLLILNNYNKFNKTLIKLKNNCYSMYKMNDI